MKGNFTILYGDVVGLGQLYELIEDTHEFKAGTNQPFTVWWKGSMESYWNISPIPQKLFSNTQKMPCVLQPKFQHSFPVFKEAGVKQYLLEVIQHNTRAVDLYKKMGFEITRELLNCSGNAKKIGMKLFNQIILHGYSVFISRSVFKGNNRIRFTAPLTKLSYSVIISA